MTAMTPPDRPDDRPGRPDHGRRPRRRCCAIAPVTVLGFARSGIALARFLADAGARVTVYDGRPADELGDAIAALDGRPVALRCSGRTWIRRRPGPGRRS